MKLIKSSRATVESRTFEFDYAAYFNFTPIIQLTDIICYSDEFAINY